jgi:predicted dehydrogenase
MRSRPPLRIGVVGLGAWGSRVLRAFGRLNRSAVVAVADRDEQRLVAALRALRASGASHAVSLHRDADSLLEVPGLDAVVLATPPSSHAALSLQALERGHHVFVEKPLATTVMDARRVQSLAATQDRIVMVGHILEHHPAIRALEQLIALRVLGRARTIVTQRLGAAQREEGAWWSLAPHDLGLIERLGGEIMTVRLRGAPGSGLRALVSCRSGVRARVDVAEAEPPSRGKVRRLLWVGTNGAAVFDDVDSVNKLRVRVGPAGAPWETLDYDSTEPLLVEARAFEAAILDRVSPRTDAGAATRIVRALVAGQRALELGKSISMASVAGSPNWSGTTSSQKFVEAPSTSATPDAWY